MDTDAGSTSPKPARGANVRFPPPLVPLLALVVGLLLSWTIATLPMPFAGPPRIILGSLLFVAGIGLILAAGQRFRETGQDPKPWLESPSLIAKGIYRFTRNPMYLGMGVLQAGIGVLANNGWMVLLVPVSWWTIYLIAIRHEEAYLEEKFGESYRGYKETVRRWI